MIDITKEELWNSDYETNIKKGAYKTNNSKKIIMIGLTLLSVILGANLILIYTFFNLLNKI